MNIFNEFSGMKSNANGPKVKASRRTMDANITRSAIRYLKLLFYFSLLLLLLSLFFTLPIITSTIDVLGCQKGKSGEIDEENMHQTTDEVESNLKINISK